MLPIFAAFLNLATAEPYMQRCFSLARRGRGQVAPNPMVGAVLVHNGQIIGEGYHRFFGGPHAEVACLNSVGAKHRSLIAGSELFVSLEPCAHYGKTPPCTELIIRSGIKKLVIGCEDPFPQVAGKGISALEAAGVHVQRSQHRDEALALNKRFITFHTEQRPYVILKWAQTGDGMIGHGKKDHPLKISSPATDRLVHSWRSEEAGILVGTNTALWDDPQLTTRLVPGRHSTRIVVDRNLRLPAHLRIFGAEATTIILNEKIDKTEGHLKWKKVTAGASEVQDMLGSLYELNIQSILVEGGSSILQSFIDSGMWDEARVITNTKLILGSGVPAPVLTQQQVAASMYVAGDRIDTFTRAKQNNL
jgi:diaminohydroxyphosphoribosylaminopyrimidine deaminase/5-amino-6-(5-phosphoribosylamino)uracil reductase